jgi:DNA-directed RNA polymerase specialized sigma24 family protein
LSNRQLNKQQAFNEEILPHLDSLYNFALRLTTDPSDSEDLVQDTIVKAFRFFDSYEKGTNAKAWLFTYEEISNMLDVPIGTIRSRLHRGRNLLKTELYEHAKKHGYTDD